VRLVSALVVTPAPPAVIVSGCALGLLPTLLVGTSPAATVALFVGSGVAVYGVALDLGRRRAARERARREDAERVARDARRQALLAERQSRREVRAHDRAALVAAAQSRLSQAGESLTSGAQAVTTAATGLARTLSGTAATATRQAMEAGQQLGETTGAGLDAAVKGAGQLVEASRGLLGQAAGLVRPRAQGKPGEPFRHPLDRRKPGD
jgi:hypothetical protein